MNDPLSTLSNNLRGKLWISLKVCVRFACILITRFDWIRPTWHRPFMERKQCAVHINEKNSNAYSPLELEYSIQKWNSNSNALRVRQGAGNSQFLRDSCQAEPPNSAWASGVQLSSVWIDSHWSRAVKAIIYKSNKFAWNIREEKLNALGK